MTTATIIPSLTSNPPSRANPAAFPTDGDSFLNDLAGIVSAQNAVASELTAWNSEIETFKNQSDTSKSNAESSKNTALTQARNAAASQVSLWVSGTTYAVNQMVYSSVDGRQYKRILAGAGTTDPSSDPTNWEPLGWEYITNYPDIRPTLDLNFAGSQAVDPRITFTRNSIATYFDKFGVMQTAGVNQPRIDFDPVTGECKGLLIEEQRTNLQPYSSDFSNAAWTKTNATVTAAAIVAPDGTLTGSQLVESTGTVTPQLNSSAQTLISADTNISVYVKAVAGSAQRYVYIGAKRWDNSRWGYYLFNPNTGLVINSVADGVQDFVSTPIVTPVGNGWFRLSMVFYSPLGGQTLVIGLTNITNPPNNQTLGSYNGDGYSGIYIWGAQLETGAFPTSYIPTTTAQVTRAADSAVMTGTNFSSWYRTDEGSFVTESHVVHGYAARGIAGIEGNGHIAYVNPNGSVSCYDSAQVSATGTYSPGAKIATTYGGSSIAISLAGSVPVSGAFSAPHGTGNGLNIGSLSSGTYRLNGHVKRIAYYPKRLPNQILQAITQP